MRRDHRVRAVVLGELAAIAVPASMSQLVAELVLALLPLRHGLALVGRV
jgi:hypothetical protein